MTFDGLIVEVFVMVVDGSVMVEVIGTRVVITSLVIVELSVSEGVTVTLKIAVGVAVIVVCGPAIMVKVRIQAKSVPWVLHS